METFQLKKSDATIDGDYCQICFDNDVDDIDAPYFLVQCDFEFPKTEWECYIESSNRSLTGHYLVNAVDIENGAFKIRYGPADKFVVRVEYQATNEEQKELITVANEMFDNVTVIA